MSLELHLNPPEVVVRPGMFLAEVEKLVILATLKSQGFNRTRAARALGIGIRTLQRKIKQYRDEGFEVGEPALAYARTVA